MKCVILAGGYGDSLWPLSRKNYPKQFIRNHESLSAFQETITRNIPFCEEFIIITSKRYENIVMGQMMQFQGIKYRLILEEQGAGTAGAVALVVQLVEDNEEVMILPADMVVGLEGYSDAVYKAKELIGEGRICLLGMVPYESNITYGYIQFRNDQVTRYTEKPSKELAEHLFWRDDILWNSGDVFCKVSILRQEMERYCSGILKQAERLVKNAITTRYGNLLLKQENMNMELVGSFDRLVLERSEILSVVKMHCTWMDLSDFNSYEQMNEICSDLVIEKNCSDTTIINRTDGQMVVANELDNILVVNTADAVYVTDKRKAGDIKKIMDENFEQKKTFFEESPLVYRQWGTREVIQSMSGYRIRRLVIYPGMKLSEHIHEDRNENYTVVAGVLTVYHNGECVKLNAGESLNIDSRVRHQLCNDTDDEVIAIEVDTGLRIEESDMIHTDEISKEEMPSVYKLHPAYKDYLWGGTTLVDVFGKDSPYDITAESWELSAHPDGPSTIVGGIFDGMTFSRFIESYGGQVCGWKSKTFDRFPILVKFIDARNSLSVQIHPDDDYAFTNENEFGKNEMWYVMECKPGAFLYCGLKQEVSKEEIEERIANETLTDILNKVEVKKGDVVFVPSGTIHAIGAGILICEIQQNSNCTYRMYDYGRRDKNGNLRELHVQKAMDVVNTVPYFGDVSGFSEPVQGENSIQQVLSQCKYFEVKKYQIKEHEVIQMDESTFKSIVVLDGTCVIRCGEEHFDAKAGDSFFISAGRKRVHINGTCELIVTNI